MNRFSSASRFWDRVAPIDVEAGLDTRRQQHFRVRAMADLCEGQTAHIGGALGDLACGMAQEVEGVLNPPGAD